jgi:malate synthase
MKEQASRPGRSSDAERKGRRDRRRFGLDLFEDWLAEELTALGDLPALKPAARLLHELVTADEFEEFLTLPAYELLD